MSQQQNHDCSGGTDNHQYYLDIINSMPYIVYWIDCDAQLKGCNHNFVQLLGLKEMRHFSSRPYDLMHTWLPWTEDQINLLKMKDINVLFSGETTSDEEAPLNNAEGELIYYRASRTPLFDADKQIIGLVVVLVDITAQKNMQQLLDQTKPADADTVSTQHLDTPLRILLVEDNQIAQLVEKSIFEELNCVVDVASSGVTADKLFSPGKYAFVLMDISLEDSSGYAVTKSLREMEENTHHKVPIIALTSHQADIVKEDCHYYTMDGAITKPLSHEQAMQIVKRYGYHENVVVDGLRSF